MFPPPVPNIQALSRVQNIRFVSRLGQVSRQNGGGLAGGFASPSVQGSACPTPRFALKITGLFIAAIVGTVVQRGGPRLAALAGAFAPWLAAASRALAKLPSRPATQAANRAALGKVAAAASMGKVVRCWGRTPQASPLRYTPPGRCPRYPLPTGSGTGEPPRRGCAPGQSLLRARSSGGRGRYVTVSSFQSST